MENRDKVWGRIVMVLLIAIVGFAAYSLVTGTDLDIIEVVLTALIMKFGTLMDYRYGSSKSSHEKTELLNKKDQA